MKRFWILLVLLPLLLVGCGRQVIYSYDDPANPTRVTSKIEEKSFWASENLEMHFDAIGKQSTMLISLHQGNDYQTKTEEVLGGIVTMLLIDRLNRTPAPRTAVDFWSQNLVPLLGLGSDWIRFALQDWGDYNKTGSPNQHIEGDRNVIVFDSEIGNGPGSQAQTYFGDYSPIDAYSSGESSFSLNASRPYSQSYSEQTDNSRTTSTERNTTTVR